MRDHHITVLVETKNSDMSHLSAYLKNTHSRCIHNTVEFEGRKGQGVAIFIHNSISDLVHIWKISSYIQTVWLKICGSVFGVEGKVMLGGVYINPQSAARSQSDITHMFSDLHLELAEAQSLSSHVLLMGDFNAHLNSEPDTFSEYHAFLKDIFPQLKQARITNN